MPVYLKQSTASQEVPLGIFVDSTDGNTEESGLTIANTDIKIWKSGASTLANKNSGGATYISNGIYYCTLDATDTDTLGSLVIFIHVSGALAVRLECVVLAANIYDSLIGGGDLLDVSVVQWTGTNVASPATAGIPEVNVKNINNVSTSSVTAINANQGTTQPVNFTGTGSSALAKSDTVDIAGAAVSTSSAQIGVNAVQAGGTAWASGAITSASIADGGLTASKFASDFFQTIWDKATSALTTVGSIGKLLVDNINATISSRLPTSSYTAPSNSAIAAIQAKTDNLPSAPASTGDVTTVGSAVAALNNISTAQVKTQVVAALSTDTYAEPTAPPAATTTLAAKINWLALLARNKITQTDSLQTVYADNGTTIVATADVSDDGTLATRAEMSA